MRCGASWNGASCLWHSPPLHASSCLPANKFETTCDGAGRAMGWLDIGKLHFVKFETAKVDDCVAFIEAKGTCVCGWGR